MTAVARVPMWSPCGLLSTTFIQLSSSVPLLSFIRVERAIAEFVSFGDLVRARLGVAGSEMNQHARSRGRRLTRDHTCTAPVQQQPSQHGPRHDCGAARNRGALFEKRAPLLRPGRAALRCAVNLPAARGRFRRARTSLLLPPHAHTAQATQHPASRAPAYDTLTQQPRSIHAARHGDPHCDSNTTTTTTTTTTVLHSRDHVNNRSLCRTLAQPSSSGAGTVGTPTATPPVHLCRTGQRYAHCTCAS